MEFEYVIALDNFQTMASSILVTYWRINPFLKLAKKTHTLTPSVAVIKKTS